MTFGNRSETFTLSGGNFISVEKSGSTLTVSGGLYTYTTADGTVVIYQTASNMTMYGYGTPSITNVILPTGEKLSYNYKVVDVCIDKPGQSCYIETTAARLQSVTSTNGYMLKMTFQTNVDPPNTANTKPWFTLTKVTALNMSVDYCETEADTCSYSKNWPYLGMSGVTSFTDAAGQVTTYTFTSGKLTGIKRPGAVSDTTTISYVSGKVSEVINEGIVTGYSFVDNSGIRTATITDAVAGDRIVKSDIANAQVTQDINEDGKITEYEYHPSRLLKKVIFPEDSYIAYDYDLRGNVTCFMQAPKTAPAELSCTSSSTADTIVTTATYPPSDASESWRCASGYAAVRCNKPLTTTDAKGNVTKYEFDNTHGGIAKVTLPAASGSALCSSADIVCPETRYSYDSSYYAKRKISSSGTPVAFSTPVTRLTQIGACQNDASCTGAADESKTVITYSGDNVLPTSIASGSGSGTLTATTTIEYDEFGNMKSQDGPLGSSPAADKTVYYYDALRRVTGIVGPDPDGVGPLKFRAQKFTYTDNFLTLTEVGTASNQNDPTLISFSSLQQLTSTYDGNRKTKDVITAPTTATKHQIVKYSYDSRGMLECTALRMNKTNWDDSKGACSLENAGTMGPDRVTRASYDAVGRVKQVQSAYGVTTANGYPATLQRTDEYYTYTDNGRPATLTDSKGNLTTYEYDGYDRLLKTRYPLPATPNASSTTDYEQFSYDANGNIIERRLRGYASDATQKILYSYDNLNRLITKDLPGSEPDVSYGYDLLGRMTLATQTGNALGFTYDALGRNLTQTGPLGTVTSTWDIGGRRTRLDLPGGFYTTYDYLVTGEMTAVRESGATTGPGVLATFSYDDLGNRTGITRGNGTSTSFTPDAVSRLSSLTQNLAGTASDQTLGFTYNPASQIISRSASNDAYAMGQQWNANRSYEANGLNQYTKAGAVFPTYDSRGNLNAQGQWAYAYSSENLLKSATLGSATTTLGYDPAMRLYQLSGSATTRFLYDGTALVAEYDGSGTLLKRYAHGPGTDEPIVWYEGSGTSDRRWLHADERGSIIALSDGSGNALRINAYDEWGNPQTSNLGRFGYTGQTWLGEIDLWYYKARMYSPRLGRFMQTDPIGYDDGMNLYAYVRNDPVNATDPSGLIAWNSICSGGGTVYEAGIGWVVTGMQCSYSGVYEGTREGVRNPSRPRAEPKPTPGKGVPQSANLSGDNACVVDPQSCITVVGQRQPKAWINYSYPGFYSHVTARHFGSDVTFGSIFRPQFQNEASLFSLAAFAANNSPLRNTNFPGVYRYTANYSGTVGYLQGTGLPTSLITLIVRDTGTLNQLGQRVLQPVTLYPGAGLP